MKVVWYVVVFVVGLTTQCLAATETDPCAEDGDILGCLKYKIYETARGLSQENTLQVTEGLSIVRNTNADANTEVEARGVAGLFDSLANYIRTHDVIMREYGTTLTMTSRGLDQGKVDVSLKVNQDEDAEEVDDVEEDENDEGRSSIKHKIKHKIKKIKKSKLRKLIVPVVIVLLLKAITLIPLLIGVLGVKTWNALQLGFGSFLVSFALGVFQLCTKLTDVFPKPPPVHPWQAARGFGAEAGPQLAYRAHQQ